MRSNKKTFLIIIALLAIFTQSCKKTFFTDANIDPNVVTAVSSNVLLSTSEAALGYTVGGDVSRFSSYFDQQVFGKSQQSQTYYQYGTTAGAFDNAWGDLYTSTMENDYTLEKQADAAGQNIYSGISRILMAYTLQVTSDCWGNIPYSQSFQGNTGGIIAPVYDDNKALYDTIASLVDVGIAQLAAAPSAGSLTPSNDDFIYEGDPALWTKFGHAIKARLYIHQSQTAGGNAAMAANAINEVDSSFAANSDNAQYFGGATATTASSWFQFNRDRPGYVTFTNTTLSTEMSTLNDPRYAIFFDPANDGLGISGSGTHYGGLNDYYGSSTSPTEFITYDELLFVEAEATLRATGNFATAQGFYQAAITANMTKLGVAPAAIATYITANGTLPTTSVSAAIAQVASQEFIALFLNPEAWTLWRRTGVPSLNPVTGTEVPRRLLYPQSEINYNSAHVPASTLFAPKIFWDN